MHERTASREGWPFSLPAPSLFQSEPLLPLPSHHELLMRCGIPAGSTVSRNHFIYYTYKFLEDNSFIFSWLRTASQFNRITTTVSLWWASGYAAETGVVNAAPQFHGRNRNLLSMGGIGFCFNALI
jgi:hypothetical protein